MNKKNIILVLLCAISLAVAGFVFAGASDPKIPVINKAVAGRNTVDFLDEDNMGTDSAAAVASQQSIKDYVLAPDPVDAAVSTTSGETGFSITAADGKVWLIDASLLTNSHTTANGVGANVCLVTDANAIVYLPTTITSAMDGQEMTFIKIDAGATNVVLWAGATATSGVSIENITGVTSDAFDIDAQGDTVTLIADATTQVYWYKADHIQ